MYRTHKALKRKKNPKFPNQNKKTKQAIKQSNEQLTQWNEQIILQRRSTNGSKYTNTCLTSLATEKGSWNYFDSLSLSHSS